MAISKTNPVSTSNSPADPRSAGGDCRIEFEKWYSSYADELLRFCQSRLGSVSGEDVFQQVWLKVLRHPTQFVGGNARAWLFQIARTSIIDFVRKKKPQNQPDNYDATLDDQGASVLDQLVANEDYETFRNCLSKLPPEKIKLVQLRVTGHSYQQISEFLTIAVGTVGSQYHRICESLRACVGQNVQ